MMYSSGMPILYIVGMANLIATYWVDKLLCKNNHLIIIYSLEILQETSQIWQRDVTHCQKINGVCSYYSHSVWHLYVLELTDLDILNEY